MAKRKKRTRNVPVLFHHIPKCAGRAIEQTLIQWENTWKLNGRYDYMSETMLSQEKVDELLRTGWLFTFVRNPWARVVSCWAMFNQSKTFNSPQVGGRQRTLDEVIALADQDWPNWQRDYHGQPFPRHLYGTDAFVVGHLTPCTLHKLDAMDFIGQVEQIREDWEVVQDATGIRVALRHDNKSKHKHYRELLNPSQRDVIARIYAKDIERFDYTF